ncbi:hypothetical protein C6I20_03020 [Aeromicrobium sp. A1-2]|uniref:GYD domain-containing protein n=1 Tax=Aeromicrobium sp. A1-2 TaxID=2107713 RepID=UPI000E4E6217|nr:GYD domain-containing protein [Aeromicrobium sp. A1-2]AXT84264.1 hypothetical protein C6I20_03020 [Aeromicrobium sp. A1-2]
MAVYFITETNTREAMLTVKEAPARSGGVPDLARKHGLEILEWFFTTGEFDFIMKVESPDEESVAVFAMALRRSGNVTVSVLKAYEPSAWAELVGRL